MFTALAWASCHFRADWGGKAGLALLMTLSVSAALEALHVARGHVADLAGIAVAAGAVLALAVWIIDPAWLRGQWGPLGG